jgi:glycosyltransferase involved in cell wall biosynthesis
LRWLFYQALRRSDYKNIQKATQVLANSSFMLGVIKSIYTINPVVCYHGVDSDFFRPLDLSKGDFLLSVGSMTPLKGFDFLIYAVARIPENMRPRLKIVSNFANPPEREFLIALATDLRVDLELAIGVGEEELLLAYNKAKLVVYAPVREPFGLVTIESMACGTPVVAVSEGGIRETVVDNEVGILVDRDEQAFADAIQSLLADPARRKELGRKGRSHVEESWSWARAVERIDDAFESTVNDDPH